MCVAHQYSILIDLAGRMQEVKIGSFFCKEGGENVVSCGDGKSLSFFEKLLEFPLLLQPNLHALPISCATFFVWLASISGNGERCHTRKPLLVALSVLMCALNDCVLMRYCCMKPFLRDNLFIDSHSDQINK